MEARAAIVGSGFAGAATAFHLARRGIGPVVVLEREGTAGLHSSGRNAAMVRQVVSEGAIARLARDGARAIGSIHEAAAGRVKLERNGSLLLASGGRLESLRKDVSLAREAGLEVRTWLRAEAIARIPALLGGDFEEGFFCPSDGVADLASLLEHYLRSAREAGAKVILGAEVTEVIVEGGRAVGVRAGEIEVRSPWVVNAAGAWAGPFARMAGAAAIPLRPLRRHLAFTGPYPRASKKWPFVWDVAHEVYFRPEEDGLLLSPCDEAEAEPGIPDADPAALDLLREKLARHIPALKDIPVARSWAGLRTFSPDSRFVIGPDPVLPGFFWVAALGGHGVTTSHAVGSLAADLLERPEEDSKNPFSPRRFPLE